MIKAEMLTGLVFDGRRHIQERELLNILELHFPYFNELSAPQDYDLVLKKVRVILEVIDD